MDDCSVVASVPEPLPHSASDDHSLRQKLAETEEKLLKFKNFVVTLRDERNKLKEKVSEDQATIEKLKAQVQKSHNSSQLFQNLQNLQLEYDKSQDEVEEYKRTTKELRADLARCVDELNRNRELSAEQQEEIRTLKGQRAQLEAQNAAQKDSISDLESKIIVLESRVSDEQIKANQFEASASELNQIREALRSKSAEVHGLLQTVSDQSRIIQDREIKIEQQAVLLLKYQQIEHENETLSQAIQHSKAAREDQAQAIERFASTERHYQEKVAGLEQRLADMQLSHAEKVSALELEMRDLGNKLQLSETDLNDQKARFEEYRSKVTSVLKENKLSHGDYSRNVENLNMKIEALREENERYRRDLETMTKEVQCLRDDKDRLERLTEKLNQQLQDRETLKKSFDLLIADNDKLNSTVRQLQISFAKEKAQMTEQNKEQCDNLRLNYEAKIKDLEEEIARLRAPPPPSDDSHSVVNSNNSNTSFEEIKDENSSIQSNGSSSLEKNFLEEILSCNEESSCKPAVHNGLNVENLTQLLAESENNINLLTEQNRVLKEEIRRLNRSIDRMDIANNLEYLKNVLLKFLTIRGRQDERDQLVGVLATILKLTPEERAQFQEHVPEHLGSNGRSAGTAGWNLWQWSSSSSS